MPRRRHSDDEDDEYSVEEEENFDEDYDDGLEDGEGEEEDSQEEEGYQEDEEEHEQEYHEDEQNAEIQDGGEGEEENDGDEEFEGELDHDDEEGYSYYEDEDIEGDDYFYQDDDEDVVLDSWVPGREAHTIEGEEDQFDEEFAEDDFYGDEGEEEGEWEDEEEEEEEPHEYSQKDISNDILNQMNQQMNSGIIQLSTTNGSQYDNPWAMPNNQWQFNNQNPWSTPQVNYPQQNTGYVSNLLGSLFNKMPDFFKSKGFEFIIEPPKQIFGSKLTEEDYDTSKDLKGDNRAWNQEYMKNIKQKTSNFGVTDRQITDASEYRQLRQQLEQSNQNFQDKMFPPAPPSMLGFGHLLEDPDFQENKRARLQLKWYRPDRVFGKKFYVFREINPHGIKQGSIGDCYWLSAISAVSEFKDRIRRVMISQDTSKSGVYCVTLCINGIWQDIIVDDHFPYDEQQGGYAFNTTEHPEIWVSLLQKAWAKVHGGYFNTEGGYTSEAVQCLTGAPTADFVISEGTDDVNWRRILEGERKDYIMCASTGDFANKGNDSKDDKTGLAGNHAYSLLAAYELKRSGNYYELVHPTEQKSPDHIKLVKIRNPWGSGEWTGNWRDNDPKWNPTLMKQVGHVKADDGIFFMDLKDFKKYFEDYSITYYNPSYSYCAQQYTSMPSKDTTINFSISTAGEYYFSIHQINSRFFPPKDNYCYTTVKLVVSKMENGTPKYVGTCQQANKDMFFKADCQPGNYIAIVQAKWRRNVNQFVFSTYGVANVQFGNAQEIKVSDSHMEQILIQKARANPAAHISFQDKGYPQIFYSFEHSNDGFGYFYFRNSHPSVTLTTTVELEKFVGCKLFEPFSGKKPCITVLPGEEKLIGYKITDRGAQIKFSMVSAFREGAQNMIQQAKMQGFRYDRLFNGINVGINAYILNHPNGIFYFYENLSAQYILKESLIFDLNNAKIEAIPGKNVDIQLRPGQTYILNVVPVVQGQPFNIAINSCRFGVESEIMYPSF